MGSGERVCGLYERVRTSGILAASECLVGLAQQIALELLDTNGVKILLTSHSPSESGTCAGVSAVADKGKGLITRTQRMNDR